MMTLFAMVFPGQGSQTVGMLAELAARYKLIEETFAQASTVLHYDLWKLVQQGPAKELNKTWQTQPALLAASVAIWRLWQHQGGEMPALMAGHSLGEYSALVCANVLDFAVAIKLVEQRGRLMQEAVPNDTGVMLVIIGLNNNTIARICEQVAYGQVVSPANFNAPGQVVISGHKDAVRRACIACKAAGAKRMIPLPINVPSHCALMKPAADKLALALKDITFYVPTVPIVNNIDMQAETDPVAIRQALVNQLYSPIRWVETVEYLANYNIKILLEMGPGKVLTGFTKRIISSMVSVAVNNPTSLTTAINQLSLRC